MAKILIADDDQVMLGLLTTLMELEGDTPVTVSRAEEIVPAAQREQPDLILMDYHLSGGSSMSALRALRADPALADIPVLVASGMDYKTECLREGATDFILKPFRPAQLLDRIHELLAQR